MEEKKEEQIPVWIEGMIKRSLNLNRKYKDAYREFAGAYNLFLTQIDLINKQYNTTFSFDQAFKDFQGEFTMEEFDMEEEKID